MSEAPPTRYLSPAPPRRDDHRAYIAAAVAADALGWIAALGIAVLPRCELVVSEIDRSGLLATAVAAGALQVLVGLARHAYRARRVLTPRTGGLTGSVFVVGLVVFAAVLMTEPLPVPRSTPLIAIPIAALLLVGSRAVLCSRQDRPDPGDPRRVRRAVVVGSGDDHDHLVRSMLRDPGWGVLPVATLAADGTRNRIAGLGRARAGERMAALAERHGADLLVIATAAPVPAAVEALSAEAADAGMSVLVVPPLAELVRSLAPGGLPAPSADEPVRSARDAARPRPSALDVALCLVAMPLVLPVLLAIAVVLLVTGGDVLYRAPRVGRHGRRFTMLKFATMRPGDSGPRVTRQGDPRITRVGRVLRSSKLNELPQILNVLRGDMSIVGPRPEDPRYARAYSVEQRAVWSVRPGMTGVAYLDFGDEQLYIERASPVDIESYYLDELLPAKLELELGYVRAWSVRGDVAIIARTLGRLVSAR